MIVTVKAEDLRPGMETVGPEQFNDCGTVERVEELFDYKVRVHLGGDYIDRPPGYEFEVFV